jgi:putative ABC transport system permease protein
MRKVVAVLLYLFPAEFRRSFGADMLATFDDRWQERPGWSVAARTTFDLATAAARERLAPGPAPVHDPKGDSPMTILWQDLRFAFRTLLRSRGFTIVALATLALGIGVNTAMFSVAHAVLWQSVPYPHPDRLVMVGEVDAHDPNNYWGSSYPNFLDWRAGSKSFEHLAAVMSVGHILREGPEPIRILGMAVTPDFFDVMGVPPAAGRVFGAAEGRNGAPAVIVLSHRLWAERLAGDPNVLGRSIRFGTTVYSVIGVMPAGFEYQQAEFWTALEQEIGPHTASHRNVWVLSPVGRLRAGVTEAEAQREVEVLAARIRQNYPETRRGQVVRAVPMKLALNRDLRPALLVLLGAVGFVLLIVCGNLAGLMLVRGAARAREMAIRSALGVGRRKLIRQLLTESAVLAAAGGAAGIGLAYWATRSIALLTKDPRLLDVRMDGEVLAFAAAVMAATTILFGIVPAIRASRVDAGEALKSGARTGSSREHTLAQRFLVVAEVALCLVLLAGAGLLLKSFRRVFEVNLGFRAQGLATLQVSLPLSYTTHEMENAFYRRVTDRLAALPGVTGATIASQLPITGGEGNGDISIEGRPSAEGELGASTFRRVMPAYFGVLGIPIVRGRPFDEHDDGSRGPVAVINEGFARRFWPNGDAIGHRIRIGPRDTASWLTVVGVAGDVRQIGLDTEAPFSTYEPLTGEPSARFEIAVRTAGDPKNVLSSLRGAVRALEPASLIDNVQTMSDRIDDSISTRRLNLLLFGLFAGLALLLAALGLYGVVAYAAGQRTHEFGIRVALGAQPGDVLRLVLGEGLKLVLAGVAIGAIATLSLARLMTGLLFGVEPTDPLTLAAVALLLAVVAVAACWLPAQRATRVEPVIALRSE